MDTDIHVFSLWEDHVVSQEKGRRVVHYYLRIPQGSKFKPHSMCCLRGLFGCFWAHKYHEFRHKVACKKRGENILLEIQRKNRVDDKWVEVKGKIDIKSFISSSLKDVSKCSIKEPDNCEKQMTPKLVSREDNKMASTCKHSTEKQDTDVLKLKKRRCIDFLAGNKN